MRLLRALAGAALVPPVLWLLVRLVRPMVIGGDVTVPSGVPRMVLGIVTFVLPVTMVWLGATVVPLIRLCARRGRTTAGVAALVGAGCGLVTTLLLYAVLASDRPFPPDAGEIVNVLVIAPALGALSSWVYWYLLDPASHYRSARSSAR